MTLKLTNTQIQKYQQIKFVFYVNLLNRKVPINPRGQIIM